MTRIKYATIGHARKTDDIEIIRGKKTGKVGFHPSGDGIFNNPIFSERVVELPEQMSPSEYRDYIENVVAGEKDDPISEAMYEVGEEKGIDTSEWKL